MVTALRMLQAAEELSQKIKKSATTDETNSSNHVLAIRVIEFSALKRRRLKFRCRWNAD